MLDSSSMNTFSIGDVLVMATLFTGIVFAVEQGRMWLRQNEWRRRARESAREEH